MKKILHVFVVGIAGLLTINVSAQIPDYGIWPTGIQFTDINGTTHDIDAILDAGKPVFIDAFADWCGPCWNYHQGKALENLYNQYGPNGTDELMVFGVESDPAEPESNISNPNTGAGNWAAGTSYPLANDDNLSQIINLAYYPTIIMVCPNRMVTEVGPISTSALYSKINNCGAPASLANDPRLVGNESEELFCKGGSAKMAVVMQNYSTAPLTSATLEVFDGSTSVLTSNWTGNLAPYEATKIVLGDVSPTAATNYTIKITSSNENTANDEVTALVSPASVLQLEATNPNVTFSLDVDKYTSEIGIVFDEGALPDASFVSIHNNAASGATNPLGFVQVGSYPDNSSPITETWAVNNTGCHYALFLDYYGDGYVYEKPNASITISGIEGSSIPVDPNFGQATFVIFDIQFEGESSVEAEKLASSLKVYPNPSSNMINVDFELQNQNEVTVEVLNTVGQTVVSRDLGAVSGLQTTQLDVSALESGMYIIRLATLNGKFTKRISVIK